MMLDIVRANPARRIAAATALAMLIAFPGNGGAQSEPERATTLRETAAKLREAAAAAERAADLLESDATAAAGSEAAAAGAGAKTDGDSAAADTGPGEAETIVFLHALDNQPIEFTFRPDQEITPQVTQFKQTGENPYRGDADAIQAGQKLYTKLCQACHLKDGTGRIGPNLIDDQLKYPRTDTDVGMFEIIYAGGAGAMQPFGRRIDQDDILKVMAYVETLGKE